MPGTYRLFSFKANQNLFRYAKNTGWIFFEKIAKVFAGVFVGMLVARYLGPYDFGVLNYSLSLVTICSAFAKLGLDSIVVRDLIRHPEQKSEILSAAFWLKFFSNTIVVLGLFSWFSLVGFGNSEKITIIICTGLIFQSLEVIDFYYQANVLSKYISIIKIFQLLISISLNVLFVYLEKDVIWFAIVLLLDQFLLAISQYFVFKKNETFSLLKGISFSIAKRLLNDSFFLLLSTLMISIYLRIDQVVIKKMLGEEKLGLFSAAIRLSEVWYIVPTIITTSLTPAVFNAKRRSNVLYYKRMQFLTDFLVWASIIAAFIALFFASFITELLYGEHYAASAGVFAVHIWTGVFASMGVSSGVWYLSEGYQKLAFYRTLVGAIISVALNYPLILKFGIVGSAYAALISQMVAALGFDLLTKKTRVIFYLKLRSIWAPVRVLRIILKGR